MKQMTKLGTLLLAVMLVVGTLFIPEQAFAAKKYPGLKQETMRLRVGQSKKLKLKNAKGLKATFYSDDNRIATVSKKGKVKAKKEGMTSIHVGIGNKWGATCRVFVDPKLTAKKTVQWQCGDYHSQTHVDVVRTVEDAPFEITVSTESMDENLKLTVYEAVSGNTMVEVGTITPDAKKLTLTATNKIIIVSETYDVVITVKVKTKDGKKTISKVDVIEI